MIWESETRYNFKKKPVPIKLYMLKCNTSE